MSRARYRLLLHGCRSGDDIENVAIFDREGYPYSFEIHASETAYTVTTGLAADEALKQAERFIRCNINVEGSELHRVLSAAGAEIGDELRSRYPVTLFGAADVLEIRYRLRDRRVVVRIMTAPAIERQRAA